MKKYVIIASLMAIALLIIFCGPAQKKQIIVNQPPPSGPIVYGKTCDGIPVGNRRSLVCEDPKYQGAVTQECKDTGLWETVSTTCKLLPDVCEEGAAEKVTFVKQILPIIQRVGPSGASCASCHAALKIETYAGAKVIADKMIFRLNLDSLDIKKMPKGDDPLSFEDRELFTKWKKDGLIQDSECVDPDDQASVDFQSLDTLETAIVKDLGGLNANGKKNARYLVNDSRVNLGSDESEKDVYRASLNKALNSISTENEIVPCTPIDSVKSACRVDLKSFGLTAAEWQLIVDNSVLVLESKTDKGEFIKLQTEAKIPFLAGDQFVRGALDFRLAERQRRAKPGEVIVNPYYEFLAIPTDQKTYLAGKGVDLQEIFDDFEALCGGSNLSPISLYKNRLVCIAESDDGICSITFDPILALGKSNLFQNPFVFVQSDNLFAFDASEVICDQENGGQEYSLWNAAGVRQDAAPEVIVKNTSGKGGDTEIRVGKTCNECHSKGIIQFQDELRATSLGGNAENFDANELDFIRLMYGPQGALDARFISRNDKFKTDMARIGVNTDDVDPVNYVVDRFVKQWSLAEVCAFIRIPIAQCKEQINQSDRLNNLVGALTKGGTISFDLFVDTFPVFIDELRLGVEPIERQ